MAKDWNTKQIPRSILAALLHYNIKHHLDYFTCPWKHTHTHTQTYIYIYTYIHTQLEQLNLREILYYIAVVIKYKLIGIKSFYVWKRANRLVHWAAIKTEIFWTCKILHITTFPVIYFFIRNQHVSIPFGGNITRNVALRIRNAKCDWECDTV
jgi:hypothetical protein